MSERVFKLQSLVSRGSLYQLKIAVILMTVIPVLALCYISLSLMFPATVCLSVSSKMVVAGSAMLLGASGYLILRKYPANIVRLRKYLRNIAEGDLPDRVALFDKEDDLSAIEDSLNSLLAELRRKVKTLEHQLVVSREMQRVIQEQAKEILEAERHRVMIQSIGAACHHIGQPATVLRTYLHIMKKKVPPEEAPNEIDQCVEAVNDIVGILDKLRKVSEYRTVPYQTFMEKPGDDAHILDIDGQTGKLSSSG